MEPQSFKCSECEFSTENLDSLRIHASKRHKITSQTLYVRVFLNGIEPVCECGCGEAPKFNTLQSGFRRFVNSHNNRVHNNWGHNKKALEKSQAVRREMWKNGEIKAWCEGNTKESDPRIAKMSEKIKTTIRSNVSECEERSKRMTHNRLTKIVPDLRGKDHGRWRGGSSSYQALSRSRIHSTWVYPKLLAAKFTCTKCGSQKDLCVHHDQERFADILPEGYVSHR